ncbi:MAG TPA: VCBS repeat-containing protein [Phycisphaerae bacterium]|nr:VCBS repeat-containing protein [Phycisphaerae bacterium]
MKTDRMLRYPSVWILLVAAASACLGQEPTDTPAGTLDPQSLFREPVALVNAEGKPIITRRAVGHPVVLDFNADGRNDVLLGCHRGMDTAAAEILLLENVGTQAEPRFRWPTSKVVRLQETSEGFSVSCGCKSGGTFEVFPADYNADGHFDLVVNTFWQSDGVRVLMNTGKSRENPTFVRGAMLHKIGSHGRGSGGGDWDGDGVMDFVFPVNRYGWGVYPGQRDGRGGLRFADKPSMTHAKYRIVGQDGWFEHSPYAWNFSGRCAAGSDKIEIVASASDPANKDKPYSAHRSHVEFYVLDRSAGTVTRTGRVWTNDAALMRMSIGDLNGDGSMDLLCTGGVFTGGAETKIWVLYGKAPNIPSETRRSGPRPGEELKPAEAAKKPPAEAKELSNSLDNRVGVSPE